MQEGRPVELSVAIAAARRLIQDASHPVAFVSNWGSNEELEAFRQSLGARFKAFVKQDWLPQPGERLEDDLLIQPDKNPIPRRQRAVSLRMTAPRSIP